MRSGITFLNGFVFLFTLCCCIGVNFFDLFADLLPDASYSDVALRRALIVNLTFIYCAGAALVLQGRILSRKDPQRVAFRELPVGPEAKAVVVLGSIFIIAFLANWLGNTSDLKNPFAIYTETAGSGEYYRYRALVEEDVLGVAGQGTWTARKLAFNVSPFVLILLSYLFYRTKNWLFLVLGFAQSVPPVLVAGILAHKSFLVVALLAPLLALGLWKLHGYTSKWLLIAFAVIGTLAGTLVFHATLNSTLDVAFSQFIKRIFITPAFTPLFYYEVVPDALPFRGLLKTLHISHVQAPAWDYSIYDVAQHATGKPYGANAHFLAVAFTGAGYLGVFLVTLLCLGLILALDSLLVELETSHRTVAFACSGFGLISVTSINFRGALENGFLVGSLIFYVLCRGVATRRQVVSSPELQDLVPANASPANT